MTDDALFEIDELTVRYRMRRRQARAGRYLKALDRVSLRWNQGETLALVGESGSGKSTLGRALLGLIQPASGSVRYRGQELRSVDRTSFRREVQIIFQDPYQSLNPRSPVSRQVSAGLDIHRVGRPGPQRVAIGLAALDAAGLRPPETYWHRYPHQLSGGERQRVVIAGAMALAPSVLICDEPVSALDISVRAQVLQVLAGLRRDRGLSLLFITHDVSLARQMADRVAVLYQGRLVEQGPTEQILQDPQHDYTKELLAAVPGARLRSTP